MPTYELQDRIKQLRETYHDLSNEIEKIIPKEANNKMLYLRVFDLDQTILSLEREYMEEKN